MRIIKRKGVINMYGYTTIAVAAGILLDFIVGDPHKIPHPVCLIGKLITALEGWFRTLFPDTAKGKRLAGTVLWFIVVMVSGAVPAAVLYAAWRINPLLYCMIASAMCCQIMATKSLKDESMKVYQALAERDIAKARYQVSMIVGRDTNQLDADGVARAAVETVAENTSDGSIAPMFYMMLGGAVLGFVYKAVNTMDSMLGYQNETYLDFGRTAAKMDDVWNFIPSRLAAIFMTLVSYLAGFDGKNAWRIFLRDRKKSQSPNSAQTESVCAGALGLRLLGDTVYFGRLHHKETVGDARRAIEAEDIRRANRLLYGTVIMAAVVLGVIRILTGILLFHS